MQSNSSAHSLNSSLNSVVSRILPISGVSVIFDWGIKERGESIGMYSQADIVDVYGARLLDELEYENIRLQHIDTRKAPNRDDVERTAEVTAGFLPVFVSCDWHDRPRKVNCSTVEFSGDHLYKLADRICESLSEWGRAYVFGHRVSRPVAVPGEGAFIRVKPFALNGPHSDEYVQRLDKLGEDIGRAIGGYLTARGEGLRR